MTEGIDTRILQPDSVQVAFSWFLRGVAVFCLFAGIKYWVRLVGYFPGDEWRFDLMPLYWQIAAPALAALFPFAALGLWMLASWGPVIWLICALFEGTMYFGYPQLFGSRPDIVIVHVLIGIVFVLFFAFMFWRQRQSDH